MASTHAAEDVLDVLVVDDHRAFADAISLAIDLQPDLRCIATVGTADEALATAAASCPAVVLLDLGLPGTSGIDAISGLRAECPKVRVIVLTANTSAEAVVAAVAAGADGFLPKEQPFADVLEAIRSDDSLAFDAVAMTALLRLAGENAPEVDATAPDLSNREREVLLLLANGYTVKEIARLLEISVHTCRGHVRSILAKSGAHSQLEAVVRAARAGLLPDLRGSRD